MTKPGGLDTSVVPGRRWRSTLLVISLAINFLVFGLVATAMVRHHLAPALGGPAGQANVFAFTRTLPQARREEIWAATREERQTLRSLRGELRQARVEFRATLEADPFDVERFKAAHAKLNEAELKARTVARALFEKVAIGLSTAERRQLVRAQPPIDGPWHRRGGPSRPPAAPDEERSGEPKAKP